MFCTNMSGRFDLLSNKPKKTLKTEYITIKESAYGKLNVSFGVN